MSGTISVGLGGLAGWRVLQRMEARHVEVTRSDPVVQRATGYFRENLTASISAEDLVGDYKMLQVALGAFGLDQDAPNKAFIRKVLESDLGDNASLANRLGDKRYLKLAKAFQTRGTDAKAAETIATSYVQREFERRVGEGNEAYRLALNARNEIKDFGARSSSDRTMWYEVLGNEPLRRVFAGAFGLNKSVTSLPVDRQLELFMSASERVLGSSSFSQIAADASIDKLITRYLALSQVQSATTSNRYTAALTLLSRPA